MMKLIKNYLYNICVGGFYQFKIFQVVDGQKQMYYIGEPVKDGVTNTAEKIEDLRKQLDAQVPLLNSFMRRVK